MLAESVYIRRTWWLHFKVYIML